MDVETGTAGSENIISTCDIGGILCPDGGGTGSERYKDL